MKLACALLICLGLFSAGQAELSLGDFSFDALKEAGKAAVDGLVEKGKTLLAGAGKDLLDQALSGALSGALGDTLTKTVTDLIGGLLGKRDVPQITDLFSKLVEKMSKLADKGKQMAKDVFSDTIEKLKSLTDTYHAAIGSIKDASGIVAHIDSVVADHHERQKRVIDALVEHGKKIVSDVVDQFKGAAAKVKEGASVVVSSLLQKAADLLSGLNLNLDILGKRGLSDHLDAIGNALSPYIDPLKELIGGVGETLKGHFSNLVDTVKGHASALKTKLDPHISDLQDHGQKLLEHGKNALGALTEVVGDILNQTVNNAGDSLSGISKTLGEAGKTVAGHFAGSDDGSY